MSGRGQSNDGSVELGVLKYVHDHPSISTIRGNPSALVRTIEEYASTLRRHLITVGPAKRDYIVSVLARAPPGPKVFLEFGAYVGYSAVSLGAALRELNQGYNVKYLTFEVNPMNAAITSSFVELAGLKDVIDVHVGPAAESVRRLFEEGSLTEQSVDFMLLDHWKNFYVADLQMCEELGLLRKGSIVVADNILIPGAPEYLAYIKQGRAEKSREDHKYEIHMENFLTSHGHTDQVAVATVV
ncbi:S-adenosyl-L-methionine-dependent methyltransferase [Lipomyces starkeyi]